MDGATSISTPGLTPAAQAKVLSREARIRAEAKEVATSFESLFLSQMFEHMTSGLDVDPTFGGGPGEKAFRSLLNSEYATSIAKAGGVGIADPIYREILELQEVKP